MAAESALRGHAVHLLLGPSRIEPDKAGYRVSRFETTDELAVLLREHVSGCDLLLMAAAVADYRPIGLRRGSADRAPLHPIDADGAKIRRRDEPLYLELAPTPDLLAEAAQRKRPNQVFVGFALEPRDRLDRAAREKLAHKGVDVIVANPLETMDAPDIKARLVASGAAAALDGAATPGALAKVGEFPRWLLDQLTPIVLQRLASPAD